MHANNVQVTHDVAYVENDAPIPYMIYQTFIEDLGYNCFSIWSQAIGNDQKIRLRYKSITCNGAQTSTVCNIIKELWQCNANLPNNTHHFSK